MRIVFSILLLFFTENLWAMNREELVKILDDQVKKLSDGVGVSFHVEELGTNQVVYSHNSAVPLIPASGIKLITTAAAVEMLGPSWTTHTQVLAQGKIEGDKLVGDLVVYGMGDPFVVSERLWLLAREVARTGIREVTGAIRINNSYFDTDRGDLLKLDRTQPYAASLSATSLNFNSVEVHVQPLANGKGVQAEFGPVPHGYATLKNEVKLVRGGRRTVDLRSVGIKEGKEVFVLSGELGRAAKPVIVYSPVEDPEAHFAHVFAAMLKREGISIGKPYGGITNSDEGQKIADLESLPLLDLIRLANTYSNNFMAEQIFRILGAMKAGLPATREKSIAATKEYLKQLPECRDAHVPNGSGLTWEARVSSLCFVKLLQKSYGDFRNFADLIGSMPVGNGTGTLKSRFNGLGTSFDPWKVRAKTGTLWSNGAVTALIGFVPSQSGKHFVFSVILNHRLKGDGPIAQMRQWEEKNISYLQKFDGT